jgi:hypothetical protein
MNRHLKNIVTKKKKIFRHKDKKGSIKRVSSDTNKCCKKTKFLYNPNNPNKSFDVYIDKNPKDTISIKYTTVEDVKNTIIKLEKLFRQKKYTHKRIWQVGMIMKVRIEAIKKHKKTKYKNAKNVNSRFRLAERYFYFLKKRTSKKTFQERVSMIFKL